MHCHSDMQDTNFYGVKNCQHCLILWNRDVNAARNIRNTWIVKNLYGEVPEAFRRNDQNNVQGNAAVGAAL